MSTPTHEKKMFVVFVAQFKDKVIKNKIVGKLK